MRTTDGGRTFVGIPAPHTEHVDQLRFANSQTGYAYGNQLWSTHDGGQQWTRVRLGGSVTELAAAGNYVFAVVNGRHGGRLMRSPVGLDDWQTLKVSPGKPFSGLWVQSTQVYVETRQNRTIKRHGKLRSVSIKWLDISDDDGFSFKRSVRIPSSGGCQDDANLPYIWIHCSVGAASGTWLSADGGETFHMAGGRLVERRSHRTAARLRLGSSSSFAAATSTVAVVGTRQLYRTANGGRTYRPVPTPRGITYWQYLGFSDSTHGVALGLFGRDPGQERLYYTTDGGRSYHYVPINTR